MGRRALLAVGTAGLLGAAVASCTRDDTGTATAPRATTPLVGSSGQAAPAALTIDAAADVDLVSAAILDELTLLSAYRAVARAHPPLKSRLRPLLTAQTAHVDVLAASIAGFDAGTSSSPPPPSRREATASLVLKLAAQTADRRLDDCLAAESGPLGRAFAAMAACHAVTAADWDQAPA